MIKIIRENQNSQTQTPEFKRWFGKSKVVDDRGNPLVVYHGTDSKFDVFDLGRLSYNSGNDGHFGAGFYFSFDVREAKTYGKYVLPVYLSIQKPFDASKDLEKYADHFGFEKVKIGFEYQSMLKALYHKDKMLGDLYKYLWLKGFEKGWEAFIHNYDGIPDSDFDLNDINDLIDHTEKTDPYGIPDYLIDLVDMEIGRVDFIYDYIPGTEPSVIDITELGRSSMGFTDFLKKEGYDGIIAGSEIVAFHPNQIKSATDNNGDFDSRSNNIYENILWESKENDLMKIRDYYESMGIDVDIFTSTSKAYANKATLSRLFVPKDLRGKGYAKQAMDDLVDWADKHSIILLLSPTNEWGASKARLIQFYKEFGFVENKGSNKNYQYMETMYRKPR